MDEIIEQQIRLISKYQSHALLSSPDDDKPGALNYNQQICLAVESLRSLTMIRQANDEAIKLTANNEVRLRYR